MLIEPAAALEKSDGNKVCFVSVTEIIYRNSSLYTLPLSNVEQNYFSPSFIFTQIEGSLERRKDDGLYSRCSTKRKIGNDKSSLDIFTRPLRIVKINFCANVKESGKYSISCFQYSCFRFSPYTRSSPKHFHHSFGIKALILSSPFLFSIPNSDTHIFEGSFSQYLK